MAYDGEILFVDDAAAFVFRTRYGAEELLGRRIWDVAVGIEHALIGRALISAMTERADRRMLFTATESYPGRRVSVAITTYPDCLHVRTRFQQTAPRKPGAPPSGTPD